MNPSATSASAAIPFRPGEDASLPGGGQWGLAIIICVVVLVASLVALRRRGAAPLGWTRGRATLIDVLESRSLAPQTRLVVARYAGRRMLLSVGPAGTQCLRDDPDSVGPQT